jgi:hypothetical protein
LIHHDRRDKLTRKFDLQLRKLGYTADTACPGGTGLPSRASGKGCVYVLVTSPDENSQRMIGCQLNQVIGSTCAESGGTLGPATGANGGCSENAPAAQNQTSPKNTFIQPWDDVTPTAQTAAYPGNPGSQGIQGQVGLPYMTLFAMDPTTGYLYY